MIAGDGTVGRWLLRTWWSANDDDQDAVAATQQLITIHAMHNVGFEDPESRLRHRVEICGKGGKDGEETGHVLNAHKPNRQIHMQKTEKKKNTGTGKLKCGLTIRVVCIIELVLPWLLCDKAGNVRFIGI